MPADAELAGVVGDDHGAVEQAVLADAAPERPFSGDLDRVRGDREPVDHRPGEGVLAHVGERLGVDDAVAVAGAQDRQEIAAALGEAGREEGEAVVAELGGDAVAGAMPGELPPAAWTGR